MHMNEKAVKIAEYKGIEVYSLKSNKFKTSTINIYFCDNLNKERVSYNALIPFVLRRGTAKYPTARALSKRCQELYGASVFADADKKGEVQIAYFSTDMLYKRYALNSEHLFEKTCDLIFDVIFDPLVIDGGFRNDYVEQEKVNLCDLIESRINDKSSYAVQRCCEVMCADEPYSIDEIGTVDSVSKITAEGLYKYYKEVFIKELPIKIFITGDDINNTNYLLEKLSRIERAQNIRNICAGDIIPQQGDIKEVTDRMQVIQGKLCLGFRTETPASSKDYFALTICNTVFGGGIHSKLFQNVREKASLAYYASSRIDKFKGLLLVSSGIEINNKDKAQEIILKQLEDIRKGNVSEYEFSASVKSYINAVDSLKDGQRAISDFFLGQILLGLNYSLIDLTDEIKKVTVSDIVEISQRIKLDTVYFLTSQEA